VAGISRVGGISIVGGLGAAAGLGAAVGGISIAGPGACAYAADPSHATAATAVLILKTILNFMMYRYQSAGRDVKGSGPRR
jgi:hypothetical protein